MAPTAGKIYAVLFKGENSMAIRAHLLAEDGTIINTIVVDSLDFMPGLIDASIGGGIGDAIKDGVVYPKNQDSEEE
jgi:hypothetical protein